MYPRIIGGLLASTRPHSRRTSGSLTRQPGTTCKPHKRIESGNRTATKRTFKVLGMNEAQFQAAVIQIARLNGWRVFHPKKMQGRDGTWRTALTGDNGWPDLVLAHQKRGLIVAELKATAGRLTPDQHLWLTALAPWAEVHVWRPNDLETIAARLGTTPQQN
jgi:hypothetical protein